MGSWETNKKVIKVHTKWVLIYDKSNKIIRNNIAGAWWVVQ